MKLNGSTRPTTTRKDTFSLNVVAIFRYFLVVNYRYAVMENMRHLLTSFDASTAIHLGFRYENPNNGKHFMSGGSGYVLTKEAIRRFVELGIGNVTNKVQMTSSTKKTSPCSPGHEGLEDAKLGTSSRIQ